MKEPVNLAPESHSTIVKLAVYLLFWFLPAIDINAIILYVSNSNDSGTSLRQAIQRY